MHMAENRTEKYGLTRSTSKPIKLACWDWSVAVKTLQAHHEREPAVLGAAVNDFNAGVGAECNPPLDALRQHATRLVAIAENLRNGRAALVDELVGMWPAIQDVVDEEKDLRPSGSVLLAEESDPTPPAPTPIVRDGVSPVQWLQILAQAVQWTSDISYRYAASAVGPCYLLSKVIEYPTPQASGLRDIAEEARDHLLHFLAARYSPDMRVR
jgi:hypothetical protein